MPESLELFSQRSVFFVSEHRPCFLIFSSRDGGKTSQHKYHSYTRHKAKYCVIEMCCFASLPSVLLYFFQGSAQLVEFDSFRAAEKGNGLLQSTKSMFRQYQVCTSFSEIFIARVCPLSSIKRQSQCFCHDLARKPSGAAKLGNAAPRNHRTTTSYKSIDEMLSRLLASQ